MTRVLRRLWWALLPYYGWTRGDGPNRAPLYAYPLSVLYHVVNWLLRGEDKFGPNFNRDNIYANRPRWSPWQ